MKSNRPRRFRAGEEGLLDPRLGGVNGKNQEMRKIWLIHFPKIA
jgi:hypothetical protein